MRQKHTLVLLAALTVSIVLTLAISLSETGQGLVLNWLDRLDTQVDRHFWSGLAIYIVTFVILVTLALPLATIFIVAGGFVFGLGMGSFGALASLSLASILTFQMVRHFGDAKTFYSGQSQDQGNTLFALINRHALFYVTVLRIVPVAPTFVVNVGAAFTRLGLAPFALASTIGFIPSVVIYAAVGAGLDTLLDAQNAISPALLLQPVIAWPLLGVLALFSATWLLRKHLPGLRPQA